MGVRRFIKVTTGGTPREMGVDMGRAVAPILRELVVESESLYRRHFGRSVGKVRAFALRNLLPAARSAYPRYVEEVQGIAEGAGIPFGELFFIAADEELAELWGDGEHCSSAAVRVRGSIRLIHNEDYPPRYLDRLVIVDARPDGAPPFLAVTYPYMLCGPSCGMNGAGMAFAADSLRFPARRRGIPTNFILRDLYRSTRLSDVARRLRTGGALMGNAVVAVSAKEDGAAAFEAHPDGAVAAVRQGDRPALPHTNHVLSPDLDRRGETPTFGSRVRLAALDHHLQGGKLTSDALRATLSCEEHGILRPVAGPHDSCTVASVVLDPARGEIEVAKRGRNGHGFLPYRMRRR